MRMPIVSSLPHLDAGPRSFLLFTAANVISWQCLVGPALILFARKLDMPASWVGLLISFMPLSMLLVAVTVPLVSRYGPKPLMFTSWLLRNVVSCMVFLMPWAIHWWGVRAGWYVLGLSTLTFCIMRAVGAGGWFPWLHEVVPEKQRATFFSTETAIAQLVSVGVILGQSLILRGEPGIGHFLVIYAIGIGAGMLSLVWMRRVPGGRAAQEVFSLRATLSSYTLALHNRLFVRFVLVASAGFSVVTWLSAAMVLYLRDGLGMPSHQIMLVIAGGSIMVFLTISAWGRYADHSGSGHAMALSMVGHVLAAVLFMTLLPWAPWTPYLVVPAVALANVFSAAYFMAAHRAMLNYVQATGRVGYTSLWIMGTSLALGATPIAAGQVIHRWQLAGFEACFLIAAAGGIACAVLSEWTVRDSPHKTTPETRLLHPALPWRTLARIMWITVGLHPSNRRVDS